ncbi:MAG: HAD family phosphatase [Thermoleophilaceae bacterium]|nr:HAD family phosphatase [Thermoleophilaceae bacterium]
MIRAVVCDFGGVLTTPLVRSFLAYQERSGISLEDLGRAMAAASARAGDNPLFQLERGEITERQFMAALEEELGQPLDGFAEHYFDHLERNDAMIDYMRELRGRGLRMALLTNNVREWEPLWRAKLPELDEIFEVVVDSAFVGMRKPEPGIFELMLERLGGGIAAEECVFVDDLEHNCEAARALGMTAVRYESAEQAIADVEAALAASR